MKERKRKNIRTLENIRKDKRRDSPSLKGGESFAVRPSEKGKSGGFGRLKSQNIQ